MPVSTKVGLEALLTPENCALLLIDHQPFQLANVNSHEPTMVINNVTGLAKTAKVYGIPTVLTTVNEERGGAIFKQIQAVFPEQKTINRTFINSWEDRRVVEAVRRTARIAIFTRASRQASTQVATAGSSGIRICAAGTRYSSGNATVTGVGPVALTSNSSRQGLTGSKCAVAGRVNRPASFWDWMPSVAPVRNA